MLGRMPTSFLGRLVGHNCLLFLVPLTRRLRFLLPLQTLRRLSRLSRLTLAALGEIFLTDLIGLADFFCASVVLLSLVFEAMG